MFCLWGRLCKPLASSSTQTCKCWTCWEAMGRRKEDKRKTATWEMLYDNNTYLSPKDYALSFLLLPVCQPFKCHCLSPETSQSCWTLKKQVCYTLCHRPGPWHWRRACRRDWVWFSLPPWWCPPNKHHPRSSSDILTLELALDGILPCTDCSDSFS